MDALENLTVTVIGYTHKDNGTYVAIDQTIPQNVDGCRPIFPRGYVNPVLYLTVVGIGINILLKFIWYFNRLCHFFQVTQYHSQHNM